MVNITTSENEVQRLYAQYGITVPVGDLSTGKAPVIGVVTTSSTTTSVTAIFNVMSGAEITSLTYKVNNRATETITPQKGVVTITVNSLTPNSGPYTVKLTAVNENGSTVAQTTVALQHYTDWAEPESVLKGNKFIADGEEMTGIIETKEKKDILIVENKVTVPTGYFANPVEVTAGSSPKGTKTITNNGTGIDVTDYAAVDVAVPASAVDSGTKSITTNGTGIDVVGYAAVDVAVPASAVVSGTKSITENGEGIDVTNYASVDVAVSGGGGIGDGGIVVTNAVITVEGGQGFIDYGLESYSMFDFENHEYWTGVSVFIDGRFVMASDGSVIVEDDGEIMVDPIVTPDFGFEEGDYQAYLYIFEDTDVSCPLYIVPFTLTFENV